MILSVSPVILEIPGRPVDLQLRVTAPVTGTNLPVILLSHGHGSSNNLSSLNGYAPLAQAWAALGFVVLQPTHLSSRTLAPVLGEHPDAPLFWRSRAEDMTHLIDRLDEIEAAVPQLAGRLDHTSIAAAGHSLGGYTTSLLLGARTTDPTSGQVADLAEPRIKAGILLAAPGRGGEDVLTGPMAQGVPAFLHTDFSTMATPALVVAGDEDDSQHFTHIGPSWHIDPYRLAPGPKDLLSLTNAEHGLGGIAGHDAAETTDENPDRVTALAELSAAYLRTQFDPADAAWKTACEELDPATGRVESK